jgi:hypothetical protein
VFLQLKTTYGEGNVKGNMTCEQLELKEAIDVIDEKESRDISKASGIGEFVRSRVEQLLVVLRAEIVSLAFVDGLKSGITIHPAHRAKRVFVSRYPCFGVDLVRIWVQPAASLVFH